MGEESKKEIEETVLHSDHNNFTNNKAIALTLASLGPPPPPPATDPILLGSNATDPILSGSNHQTNAVLGSSSSDNTHDQISIPIIQDQNNDDEDQEVPLDAYLAPTKRPKPAVIIEGSMVVKEDRPVSSKTILLALMYLVVFVALILGLALGLREKTTTTNITAEPSSPPTVIVPTSAPSSPPTSLGFWKVVEQVAVELPDLPVDIENSESASYKAASWMATPDGWLTEGEERDLPIGLNDTNQRFAFRQRYALATFYYATNGPTNWTDQCQFLTPLHVCNWTCDLPAEALELGSSSIDRFSSMGLYPRSPPDEFVMGTHCIEGAPFVTTVDLVYNGLAGTIPKELKAINFEGFKDVLTSVSFHGNFLTGTIPWESFGHSLSFLFLRVNKLEGSLPRNLTEVFPNLLHLAITLNGLTGSIPSGAGAYPPSLQVLDLSFNLFTGSMPGTLFEPSTLMVLWTENNLLSGSLPEEIPFNNALESWQFTGNFITGNIPENIANLPNLTLFAGAENEFTGGLQSLASLSRLVVLAMQENRLKGTFPVELFDSLTNLELFYVHNNDLSGRFFETKSLANWNKLRSLNANQNQFSGTIDGAAISNLTLLEFFGVYRNYLTGTLPSEIGYLTRLTDLMVNYNKLSGSFPSELQNLSVLASLWVHGTDLTGNLDLLCDRNAEQVKFGFGFIADCLEEGLVQCKCCIQCCDSRMLPSDADPCEFDADDFCELN